MFNMNWHCQVILSSGYIKHASTSNSIVQSAIDEVLKKKTPTLHNVSFFFKKKPFSAYVSDHPDGMAR